MTRPYSVLRGLASALALVVTLANVSNAAAAPEERGCAKLDVLVARGTAEPYPGSLNLDGFHPNGTSDRNAPNGVWTLIRKELTNSTDPAFPSLPNLQPGVPNGYMSVVRTDISYPAALFTMSSSVSIGTNRVVNYVNSETERCNAAGTPKKFALLGYSQGALVMGNVMTPPALRLPNGYPSGSVELTPAAKQAIIAVALFADAGFSSRDTYPDGTLNEASHAATPLTTGPAYMVGTYEDLDRRMNDGSYTTGAQGILWHYHARLNRFGVEWAGKVRNYCIFRDPICQGGSGGFEEHLFYAGDTEAKRNLAIFVIQKFRGVQTF
jgi:hypothetical protein